MPKVAGSKKELFETRSLADIKPPPSAVSVDAIHLTIMTEWHKKRGDEYSFRTERIDTPMKLLHWVHHLSEKVWFDRRTCGELIKKVCDYFGWNLHGAKAS